MDIQADQMLRDELSNTVSASGDVMIVQAGRILRADDVLYDLGIDRVQADGNVVLNEENGDIHLTDYAAYSNALRDGDVERLRSVLNDGSRFTAERGRLEGGTKITMEGASYTPCEPCEEKPDRPPVWRIVASEVEHDQEVHRVSYRHARFEALGVPIAYTPYFSHPDGTIKQKSGFLSPSFGYKSELGAFVENSYYWAIAPDHDATFGLMAMTKQAPLGLAEYRKRLKDASLELSGGVTSSDRTDRTAGQDVAEEDEMRGHVFAEGRWDIDEKWRAGMNVNWASDDQYMRQYDFTDEDVLKNELYAERFSGRDYAAVRLLSFQDIRIRETPLDQPGILPEMLASFQGEPGAVPWVKGQWYADASALGLRRERGEQDVQRLSVGSGWKRRLVSDYGLLTRVDANVRGDVYHTTDRVVATTASGRSRSSTDTRVFPQFHMQSSYPMARPFERFQVRVEPLVAFTFAPNLTGEDSIPNEDSNDVQIDASNVFESNRFPGLDRVEDRSRVTYGLRSGLFGYEGSFGDVFLGQSYRFDEDDNPFPAGSGLERQESDYVGQISASYKDIYDLDYRFQMGSNDLNSKRHEIDANADWNRFRLNVRYLYAGELEGTDIEESREQIDASAQFYFDKEWRSRFGATQDLGKEPGLRKAFVGLDYLGQCLFWSFTGERNLTRDASGDSSTEILFRVGLKNLGEFEESSLRSVHESGG
ncbi:MAG: LPS-assembly protein LptD [Rhodospirillales bacterium]|nr:LPS-assembly protein LptD [Alphaproteobacteria bacterium]USO06669.1 MAG: LPS-assembly protein LptD [Rhodospirillales bacterium]